MGSVNYSIWNMQNELFIEIPDSQVTSQETWMCSLFKIETSCIIE